MIGGRNAGCDDDCRCSVPVHVCQKCGDCDYGDNADADETLSICASLSPLRTGRVGMGEETTPIGEETVEVMIDGVRYVPARKLQPTLTTSKKRCWIASGVKVIVGLTQQELKKAFT